MVVRRTNHQGTLCDFLGGGSAAAAAVQRQQSPNNNNNNNKGCDNPVLLWFSNPGLGHPSLRKAWAPSLQRLLELREQQGGGGGSVEEAPASASGGCNNNNTGAGAPVLVTSHSAKDQESDLAAVREYFPGTAATLGSVTSAEERVPRLVGQGNPFRSLRRVVDPLSAEPGGAVVQANWGAFVM